MARWNRTGTATVTNGSTAVTGTTTAWLSTAKPGDAVTFDGGVTWYEIASIASNTALTLGTNFTGTTGAKTGASGLFAINNCSPEWSRFGNLSYSYSVLLEKIALFGQPAGVGDALKLARVNAAGTAYELFAPSGLPISTATQAALDAKAGLGANTFTALQTVGTGAIGKVKFSPGTGTHSGWFQLHVANDNRVFFFGYVPAAGGPVSFIGEDVCNGFSLNKPTTIAGAVLPAYDNFYALGASGTRYSAVYAVNGTIQTSDRNDKNVERAITGAEAAGLVAAIEPQFYRWKFGGGEAIQRPLEFDEAGNPKPLEYDVTTRPGTRLHAGFIAQDVKAGLDAAGLDFAAWGLDDAAKADSRQWINQSEMVPVLWAALRSALARIDALEKKAAP